MAVFMSCCPTMAEKGKEMAIATATDLLTDSERKSRDAQDINFIYKC